MAVCVLLLAVAAGGASFLMKPRYEAAVVMIPVKGLHLRQALGTNLTGQLSGLASLAGVNVGGAGNNKDEYLDLWSRGFIRRFIADNALLPVLFADDYDARTGRWTVDDPDDVPTLADGAEGLRRSRAGHRRGAAHQRRHAGRHLDRSRSRREVGE